MEITQPEVQTLQEQYTALLGKITLNSAEVNRLQGLSTSELYTINQLNVQKKGLEDEIVSLTASRDVLQVDVNNLTAQKYLLETSNAELSTKLDSRESEISAKESVLNDMENAVKTAGDELSLNQAILKQNQSILEYDRKTFGDRIERIKQAIN